MHHTHKPSHRAKVNKSSGKTGQGIALESPDAAYGRGQVASWITTRPGKSSFDDWWRAMRRLALALRCPALQTSVAPRKKRGRSSKKIELERNLFKGIPFGRRGSLESRRDASASSLSCAASGADRRAPLASLMSVTNGFGSMRRRILARARLCWCCRSRRLVCAIFLDDSPRARHRLSASFWCGTAPPQRAQAVASAWENLFVICRPTRRS